MRNAAGVDYGNFYEAEDPGGDIDVSSTGVNRFKFSSEAVFRLAGRPITDIRCSLNPERKHRRVILSSAGESAAELRGIEFGVYRYMLDNRKNVN